jgi:hypothetical protein
VTAASRRFGIMGFNKVLIAVDDSPIAAHAAEVGTELAEIADDCRGGVQEVSALQQQGGRSLAVVPHLCQGSESFVRLRLQRGA